MRKLINQTQHWMNHIIIQQTPTFFFFADWRTNWKRPDESGFTVPASEVENEQLLKLG